MKVYTGRGDGGETDLLCNRRVSKKDLVIEVLGCVDELNASLGWAKLACSERTAEILHGIQEELIPLGAMLASLPGRASRLQPESLRRMERLIDDVSATLTEQREFVIPGANEASARLHIARGVARRAERRVVELSAVTEVDKVTLSFLNRLSDLLFVLARHEGEGYPLSGN